MPTSEQVLLDRLVQPFRAFAAHKLAGAGLLMAAAVAALVFANTGLSDLYTTLLETKITVGVGEFSLEKPSLLWINDGLMGIFFFLVGLEIKREVIAGELASIRKATLPAVAAVGGMLVPAAIFAVMTAGTPLARGWGIPMATDIAFALGVLALLGDRVPVSLKVFLTALAIVDDIGAIVVIAVFYTDQIAMTSLMVGIAIFAVAILANRMGVRNSLVYLFLGTIVWLAFLKSGVHATIAALLMAFTIPSRTKVNGAQLLDALKDRVDQLKAVGIPEDTTINSIEQQHVIDEIGVELQKATAPLLRLEHDLAPLVSIIVLPIFAFANAGVTVSGSDSTIDLWMVSAITAGLFIGKQVGITGFAWIAVRAGWADLPTGVDWRQIYGVSLLAGVGFTMALFVGSLAFPDVPSLLASAKVGILIGSAIAGVLGFVVLRTTLTRRS